MEIQKLPTDTMLLGFASQRDATLLEVGGKGSVVLYFAPWDEAKTCVSVPLSRVTSVRAIRWSPGKDGSEEERLQLEMKSGPPPHR